MRAAFVAAAAAFFAAGAAAAEVTLTTPTSGFNYFNLPGATAEQHLADLAGCRDAIEGAPPSTYLAQSVGSATGNYVGYYYGPAPEAISGAAVGVMGLAYLATGVDAAIDARRRRYANFENCMVVRGWRVARVDETTGRELAGLDQSALTERLSAMVGANIPESDIIRRYNNDAVRAGVALLQAPEAFDEVSLSLRILPDRTPPTAEQRRAATEAASEHSRALGRMPASARPPMPLNRRTLATLDATIVVVHVGGGMVSQGQPSVVFERLSNDDFPAWKADGQPAMFTASAPARLFAAAGDRFTEQTLVFAVPPGRWRVTGMSQGAYAASFCLGGPSFEVAAGEVVYAGAFFTEQRDRGPDLSLDRARTALANAPALAERLRPAAYRNGELYPCGGSYFYALEVPDAPFREGYAFGSLASTRITLAAAPSAVETAPPTP